MENIQAVKKTIKAKIRADPKINTATNIFLSNDNSSEILVPKGYVSLDKNEEVLRCSNKIADLVSSMTIMLMQNGENGDKRINNELSKKIDVYPNKFMTRKNFIYKIVTDMILYGNAVVYPTVVNGMLEDLTIFDHEKLSYVKTSDSYVILYNSVGYNPNEVLHFVLNPSDDNYFKGQGYAGVIKSVVSNLLQANATKTGFLQSKWKPGLIMSINSDVDDLTTKENRRKVLGSYLETTEIGEPWVIPAGQVDLKTVQPLTLKDLALQESITLDKQVLATAIGMPPFMIGVGIFNKDEYNNFISTTIMSFAMIIQQELTKKLLHSPAMYFKFNSKSLLQYNLSEKVAFVKEMITCGLLSRNEGRNEFDYSPVDDDGMNDYIVLENYVPVGKVGDQKKLNSGGDTVE